MLRKFFALLALTMLSSAASAVSYTMNCTGAGSPQPGQATNTCTVVSDPFPPLPVPQPVTCKIYVGASVLAGPSPVAGPTGAKIFSVAVPTSLGIGVYTIGGTCTDANGQEVPPPPPLTAFTLVNAVPVPVLSSPTNLRVTSP